MGDKFEVFFKDLTEDAQSRMRDFDSDLPSDIADSTKAFLDIRKRPKTDIEAMLKMVRSVVRKDVSDEVVKSIADKILSDKMAGGFAIHKETGEITPLSTEDVAALKATAKDGNPSVTEITLDDGGDDCDCPKCVERRAKMSGLQEKVTSFGSGNGKTVVGIARPEPENKDDWD